jgi:hypothetical protein
MLPVDRPLTTATIRLDPLGAGPTSPPQATVEATEPALKAIMEASSRDTLPD